MPDISFKAQVLIPQKHIKWLTALPDSIASTSKLRDERLALKYLTSPVANKDTTKFLDDILRRCVTKKLHCFQADMYDEICASVDETMGVGEQWHEVKIQQTMKTVADRTGVRGLYGLKLCRDQSYMHNVHACMTGG